MFCAATRLRAYTPFPRKYITARSCGSVATHMLADPLPERIHRRCITSDLSSEVGSTLVYKTAGSLQAVHPTGAKDPRFLCSYNRKRFAFPFKLGCLIFLQADLRSRGITPVTTYPTGVISGSRALPLFRSLQPSKGVDVREKGQAVRSSCLYNQRGS